MLQHLIKRIVGSRAPGQLNAYYRFCSPDTRLLGENSINAGTWIPEDSDCHDCRKSFNKTQKAAGRACQPDEIKILK